MEIHCISLDVGRALMLHHMVYNYMARYQVCIFHQKAWQVHMRVANLQYSRDVLSRFCFCIHIYVNEFHLNLQNIQYKYFYIHT